MKTFTCRFILKNDSEYKDLASVFPEILRYVLKENEHLQTDEETEMREMFVELNMQDIRENRKPEGYNRKAKYRLVFPIGKKEFYVRQFAQKPNDIKRIGNAIDQFLATANIDYEMRYDYVVDCIPGSEGKFVLLDNNSEVSFPATVEFGKNLRASIKIKEKKKNAVFGYISGGEFRPLTLVNEDGKGLEAVFEVNDDIYFGFK